MGKISRGIFLCILLSLASVAMAFAGLTDSCPRNHYGPVSELCPDSSQVFRAKGLPLIPTANEAVTDNPYLDGEGGGPDPVLLPDVPIVINNSVDSFIRYFQTSGRPYFEKWLARIGGYRELVQDILRREGLPEDLFYVALIESGLNPRARSRRRAVGMWQFIRATARRYGLRVNWWIDERMDPEKATEAAARYLRRLYERFGSWQLAIASYNAGEGTIARAMKRYKTRDFWQLARHRRPLRRETRQYLPKYMAAVLIARNPEKYGFKNLVYEDEVIYEKVSIPEATDIKVIARAAGMSVREFKRLNPELIRWFTPPGYKDYEIKLPPEKVDTFMMNFSKVAPKDRLKFYKHRVRRGDTLWAIARKYKTRISLILYLNNLKNPRYIRPGKLIVIPVRARKAARHRHTRKAERSAVLEAA